MALFGNRKIATARPAGGAGAMRSEREESPYVAARREWNERYGSYIAQARNWRLAFFCATGIACMTSLGAVWIGAQSKFIPYVIEKDGSGNIVNVGYATKVPAAGVEVMRAYVARFFQDARTVTTDFVLEKQAITRLYAMLPQDSAALYKMNEHFKKDSPFARAATETVSVEVDDPLPITDRSWAVEWTETTRDRTGAINKTERWKATAQVAQVAGEKADLKNPLGVFVPEFDWTLERKL